MATFALLVYALLTLLAGLLNLKAAWVVLRTGRPPSRLLRVATTVLFILWVVSLLLVVLLRVGGPDWLNLFWSVQIPSVGLFLGSGALLCRTWRDDQKDGDQSPGWARHGAAVFFAMTLTLALAALVVQFAIPAAHPSRRETGAPIHGLRELATWGFGGPLPSTLTPITDEEIERGVGHLPRDITVPMGVTLIAAWIWIVFVALALVGRLLSSLRARAAFFLLAPIVLGVAFGFVFPNATIGPFDPRFFGPDSSRDSGIWTSDPELMRSYGPVVLAAVIAAVPLAACRALERAASGPAQLGN